MKIRRLNLSRVDDRKTQSALSDIETTINRLVDLVNRQADEIANNESEIQELQSQVAMLRR
jgi:SMC interacting uncharacterized protein involved in chromosome segregation